MTTPERRYQVFVSSTYLDLREARGEVMQALLELDCMPAGMEIFPAANDDQWNWIKRVIEESDYYVVILAGRYGSVSTKTGLSYTEMEYRYAVQLGKPVIGFVHEDPKQLPAKYFESDPALREKLNDFRDLVRTKLCKNWTSPADLGAKVSRSLTQLIRQHPAIGWIRADMTTPESAQEALALRRQIEELKTKLEQITLHGPAGTETLEQGTDMFCISFSFDRSAKQLRQNNKSYWVRVGDEQSQVEISWDRIFSRLALVMIEPATNFSLVNELNTLIFAESKTALDAKYPEEKLQDFRILKDCYNTITVQLRALGLITTAGELGSWTLTEYGDAYMNKLLAVHRKSQSEPPKVRAKRTVKSE
jgi:Domain of unknown function (DUF4062)